MSGVKVGLVQLDGKRPNLALMRLSAFHREAGDEVAKGRGDITYISCVFKKNRQRAEYLVEAYGDVLVGGPGWDLDVTLPPEVESCKPDYDLWDIDYGVGYLTKGCPGNCEFCVVPKIEGLEARTVNTIGDLLNPKSNFVVVYDANLLANPDAPDHLDEIFERGVEVCFDQGLDIRYVTPLLARKLARVRVSNFSRKTNQLHFAWDKVAIEPHVEKGIQTLNEAGIKPYRLMFFVLCGFDSTFEQDFYRFRRLREWGCDPFIMLYEGADKKLRHFARWVNKRIYKVCDWKDYDRYTEHEQMTLLA